MIVGNINIEFGWSIVFKLFVVVFNCVCVVLSLFGDIVWLYFISWFKDVLRLGFFLIVLLVLILVSRKVFVCSFE